MKAVLAFTCAAGLAMGASVTTSAAPQSQSGQDQRNRQTTQGQQGQGQSAQQTGQTITMSGCVYQTSDQPTLFAVRRMEQERRSQTAASGSSTSPSRSTSTSGSAGDRSTATTGTSGPSGAQPSTAGSQSAAASGGAQNTEGAWYRLAPGAGQDLKQYTGQHVRINGRLMPGRDEKGADVVIHRIEPDRTVVTAVDLKPAPELSISSITPLGGSCEMKQDQQNQGQNQQNQRPNQQNQN